MDDEKQRAVAHRMVDRLFDSKEMGHQGDTVIWTELTAYPELREFTFRLTFKEYE